MMGKSRQYLAVGELAYIRRIVIVAEHDARWVSSHVIIDTSKYIPNRLGRFSRHLSIRVSMKIDGCDFKCIGLT